MMSFWEFFSKDIFVGVKKNVFGTCTKYRPSNWNWGFEKGLNGLEDQNSSLVTTHVSHASLLFATRTDAVSEQ